ncbi:hypothetical protein BD410DRAFT_787235 [Rickenella mellea]|uniref:Uncharacterized protein n=1 Tax=Rickenella mellea TaxID=50990 RepID=A0A4Y7Q9C4_9AGAM|nr:hypothetical protein BD410DRAFT_787235 [Rickenella mellea]
MWRSAPKTGRFAAANRIRPSLKTTPHFQNLEMKREVFGRLVQCRTGHSYTGEYYSKFVPSENVDCPCGEPYQTREHILRECKRYSAHRHILRETSRDIHIPTILGTKKGIAALSDFLQESGAFTKTGYPRAPRKPPEPCAERAGPDEEETEEEEEEEEGGTGEESRDWMRGEEEDGQREDEETENTQ